MAQAAISHFSLKKLFFVAYVTLLKIPPRPPRTGCFRQIYMNRMQYLPWQHARQPTIPEKTWTGTHKDTILAMVHSCSFSLSRKWCYDAGSLSLAKCITWCITGVFQRGREKTLYSCARVGKKDNPWFETDNFCSIWIFALVPLHGDCNWQYVIFYFSYEIFKQYYTNGTLRVNHFKDNSS